MEFDGGTAAVSIITVALLVLPFVLDHRRRAKRGVQLLRALREAAHEQGCELNAHDIHRDIAIGLDRNRKVLFFLSQHKDVTELQQVQLAQVRTCQVNKTGRGGKAPQADAPIERVELCFMPKEKAGSEIRFVLYQEAAGSLMDGEVQLAEKWAGLAKGLLKN